MAQKDSILIVEDDPTISLIIAEALRGEAAELITVASIAERDRKLAISLPTLLITDVVLPDGDGLDSLPSAITANAIPVIVLSAQNTLDTAVRAADQGSYDYLPKPFDLGELIASVRAALNSKRQGPSVANDMIDPAASSHGLVGRAPAMQAVYRTIARLASNDLAVLILGESGTGKDVVARAIHSTGLRRDGPFVAINMAAIPRDLIEAELFGHEKGAFTGAISRNAGRFEQASSGTLFLDEIGDMPMEAQTRLLRVLQSGEFSRVGGQALLRADVRIVAATHRDIDQLVRDGLFREDLYYRLNVIPVEMPALRERRSDIAALVDHFVAEGRATGIPFRRFSAKAVDRLAAHDWPGNVRELANVVQRLSVLARDAEVTDDDVDLVLAAPKTSKSVSELGGSDIFSEAALAWAKRVLADGQTGDVHNAASDIVDFAVITAALAHCGGNQLAAARALGINRNTLRKRMSALQISATA